MSERECHIKFRTTGPRLLADATFPRISTKKFPVVDIRDPPLSLGHIRPKLHGLRPCTFISVTAMAVQNYIENPELTAVLKQKPG